MAEIERCSLLGPELHLFLIGADQQAVAFLAEVIFAVAVGDRGKAASQRRHLVDRLGDEILVLGRLQRQAEPGHRRHFAAPQAGSIHHPFRVDIALFGAYDPAAIGLRLGSGDRAETLDLGAKQARAGGIGVGDARRVDIAAIGLEHDAAHIVELRQRMKFLRLLAADLVEPEAVEFGLRLLKPQLMLALLGLRQIERSRLEHTAALAGFGLELLVQVHRVMLDAGDVVVVVQPVDIRSRVPGRTACQLVALQQDDVAPAELCKVIEYRAADKPAPDNHCLRMRSHDFNPLIRLPGVLRTPVIRQCDLIYRPFGPGATIAEADASGKSPADRHGLRP